MPVRKGKPRTKPKGKRKNPQDEKLCMTKGQLCNIVTAAEKKKGACPKARQFIKKLKAEVRGNKK